jgi:hypothetical protein
MKFALLLFVLSLVGCSVTKEPASAIVQKAQACGAGDLSAASSVAAQDWFSKHHDCAVAVDQMCKPVRDKAPAAWTDSTEGRVCIGARAVAQWIRNPSRDHQTFQAGWK